MAYAAVVSLKQTIQPFLNPSKSGILLPNSEIELIYSDLCHLQSFLQTIKSLQNSKRAAALERQIKVAVENVEDLIESHLSDPKHESLTLQVLSQPLLKVKQEITLETGQSQEQQPAEGDSFPAEDVVSSRSIYDGTKNMVGLDDQLKKLKYWLLRGSDQLDIITVTGMAGIGKTTLVQKAFQDSTISYSFYFRAYVKIHPYTELRELLLLVLHQVNTEEFNKINEETTTDNIGHAVYQSLFGRKYLIVIDGIESTELWTELRNFFRDVNTRSRIILTTRLLDFTRRASINKDTLQVPFLNETESWNLLYRIVFATGETCSFQLEKVGTKIAKNCEGLPLAIVAVGNHLRKTERTVENWMKLEENDNALIVSSDDYKSIMINALSSCYKELPQHLKAYFLYMGVFPKDHKITPSKLINLWICEGLIEAESSKGLEEMGKECLDDLVSRSLVLVGERRSRGGTKTCKLHFVFRNLSVVEAQNEKLFHVINKYADSFPEDTGSEHRRLCIHNNIVIGFKEANEWMESVQSARSVLCFGPRQPYPPTALYLRFRLLKVLEALAIRFYEFPHQVIQLYHLRYLAITYDGELPSTISFLGNLEVLIVHRHHNIKLPSNVPVYLPIEIWKLHKLKQLECMGSDMPDPSSKDESFILEKLETLSGVSAYSCTREVLARMRNLKKIGIRIASAHDSLETFDFFGHFACVYEQFESFKCVLTNPRVGPCQVVPTVPNFPANIKKITLSGCGFPWEYMRVIAALPSVEVLKLRWYALCGPEWKTYEGGFVKLKLLMLEDLDLQHWESDYEHFPVLTHLIIRHCYELGRIPRGLGHITTLEMVQVDDCSSSLVDSAMAIQDEQRDLGNADTLQFEINSSWSDKKVPVS